MSYIDEFIHKLNLIPPEADKLLRLIRELDKKVEQIKVQLEDQRQQFLEKLTIWENKRTARGKEELEQMYKHILTMENQSTNYSKQKIQTAEKLYNFIHEPTQKLDRQINHKGSDRKYNEDESPQKKKRGKKPARKGAKRGQWQYDQNEPKYCYCSKPSYGEMAMCENTYCEKQWFHLDCIDEKKLPDKWYCKDCRSKFPSKVAVPAKKKY